MPENQEHEYMVRLTIGNYRTKSKLSVNDYSKALLSQTYGIVTGRNPHGEQIWVTEKNFIGIDQIDGDVAIGPTEVGEDEQETARIKELLGDEE